MNLLAWSWPASQLDVALSNVADGLMVPADVRGPVRPPARIEGAPGLSAWLRLVAPALQLDVQPRAPTLAEIDAELGTPPLLVALPSTGARRVLVVVGARGKKLKIVTPALRAVAVSRDDLRSALVGAFVKGPRAELEAELAAVGVSAGRRPAVIEAMLQDRMADRRVATLWSIDVAATAPVRTLARRAGLVRLAVFLGLAFVTAQALTVLWWWALGRGALSGHTGPGWQQGWALVLLSTVPAYIATGYLQGRFSIAAASVLKLRLLAGSTAISPDSVKHEGIGHHLGRVVEADAFEQHGLDGIFGLALATCQIAVAGVAAVWGHSGYLQLVAIAFGVLWTGATGVALLRATKRSAVHGTALTCEAVENLEGARTRRLQRPSDRWHDNEDSGLVTGLRLARVADRWDLLLRVVGPRLFLVGGLVALASTAWSGAVDPTLLAISFASCLVAYQGLGLAGQALAQLVRARVSWSRVRDIFRAGAAPARRHAPVFCRAADRPTVAQPVAPIMEARDLSFAFERRSGTVLSSCSVVVGEGDRIALEGPSGGGKSTLAALIAGLRPLQSGTLMLDGLDLPSLGRRQWRDHVVFVPQFHDNHIFSASLAFNLLMGRQWPPGPGDYRLAREVCTALGLGDLIRRMPSGMIELVGDSGWRLSHGERSRIFVARAILQNPRLLILDESFGALDPDTVRQCLSFVNQQPFGLIMISHT